jgi:hypothetical protein
MSFLASISKDVDGRPPAFAGACFADQDGQGLGCKAQFRDCQHIAGVVRIANITTMVHVYREVLRHRGRAAPFASTEQGGRPMTSGGLDARTR